MTAAVVAVVVAFRLFQLRPIPSGSLEGSVTMRLSGAIAYYGSSSYALAVPIVAGIVAGGALAAERRSGHSMLVLARGLRRWQYVFSHACAAAATAWVVTFSSAVLAFATSSFFLPWGPLTLNSGPAFEPYPVLLANYPLLCDLAVAAVFSLSSAALATSGLAAGAVVANEYVAIAVPIVIGFGGMLLATGGPTALISPGTYLSLQFGYPSQIPESLWPYAAPAYWVAFASLAVAVGLLAFVRKENA